MAPTVITPFQSCGGPAEDIILWRILFFLNYSYKFRLNKDSSCSTRSYVVLIPSCLKFSIIFLSVALVWMFGPIYTSTGHSLFGDW